MHVFCRTIFVHASLEWFWFCTSHLCITRFLYSLLSSLCHVLFSWMACPLMLCLSSVKSSVPVEPYGFTLRSVLPVLCLYLSRRWCPVYMIRSDKISFQPEPHHTAAATPLRQAARRAAVTLTLRTGDMDAYLKTHKRRFSDCKERDMK